MSADLPCHVCGYDLRAHPVDGRCPECGASVAEAARVAAIPRRPGWRESDLRWRRRMLVGAWVLVFLPLVDALQVWGWAARIPVPRVFDYRGVVNTLDDTLLCGFFRVYQPVAFCVGVALLFSREKGRRRNRLDWTRRWGVLCSYVSLLLSAAAVLFIGALVLAGIAAEFQDIPLKYQPGVTGLFVHLSVGYLRYGPFPHESCSVVIVVFSSIAMLLACLPLFDALRSSGPKWAAAILIAPLALFSLMYLSQVGRYWLYGSGGASDDVLRYGLYFWPELLLGNDGGFPWVLSVSGSERIAFWVEAAKWFIVLAIAVWLSIAQVAAWGKGGKRGAELSTADAARERAG